MSLATLGYQLIPSFITEDLANQINDELAQLNILKNRGGIRNIDKLVPSISNFANSELILTLATKLLNNEAKLVRAILFNKSESQNWLVGWHQDKKVSISARDERLAWKAWSIKDSVVHASPPLDVLESIITVRIHLDEATKNNGCLKVIPKSHNQGILSQDEINKIVCEHKIDFIEAPRNSALIMMPTLLHASSKATKPTSRKVLHLEFSSYQLPYGLSWS